MREEVVIPDAYEIFAAVQEAFELPPPARAAVHLGDMAIAGAAFKTLNDAELGDMVIRLIWAAGGG